MNPITAHCNGKYTEMENRLLDGKVRLEEGVLTTEKQYEEIFV